MKLPNGWASTQFSFRFLNETINRWSLTPLILLGKVTMMFITHAMPKNLLVDEVVRIGHGVLSAVGDLHGDTTQTNGGING